MWLATRLHKLLLSYEKCTRGQATWLISKPTLCKLRTGDEDLVRKSKKELKGSMVAAVQSYTHYQ